MPDSSAPIPAPFVLQRDLPRRGTSTALKDQFAQGIVPGGRERHLKRMRDAFTYGLRSFKDLQDKHHLGRLIIAGGAADIADLDTLREIRRLQERGAKIIAPNMTHDFLASKGIIPDFAFILDARPHCIGYVKKFFPNTAYIIGHNVDPGLVEHWKANTDPYLVFTIAKDEEEDILRAEYPDPPHRWVLLGGKTTVGMRCFEAGYYMGFRGYDLFAFASCYREDATGRARLYGYEKPILYEEHKYRYTISTPPGMEPASRSFLSNDNMARQVEEFKETMLEVYDLMSHRKMQPVEIVVHGDGAIPFQAAIMARGERKYVRHADGDLLLRQARHKPNAEIALDDALLVDLPNALHGYDFDLAPFDDWTSEAVVKFRETPLEHKHEGLTVVFFHVDTDGRHPLDAKMNPTTAAPIDYKAALRIAIRCAKRSNPGARVIVITDDFTQLGDVASREDDLIVRLPINRNELMYRRMKAYYALALSGTLSETTLFLDSDVCLNRDFKAVFNRSFDIALTWRTGFPLMPFNEGVIMADMRVPDRVTEFFGRCVSLYDFIAEQDCVKERYGFDVRHWRGGQLTLAAIMNWAECDVPLAVGRTRVRCLPCTDYNYPVTGGETENYMRSRWALHFKGVSAKGLMAHYERMVMR